MVSNKLKSLQIYSSYLSLTSAGQFVSNPIRTAFDRRSWWSCLSTSRLH